MEGEEGWGADAPVGDVFVAAEPGARATGQSHEDLRVWQEAIVFCEDVYRVTASFPASEPFGLVSQMRRASVSIPSHIAEGWGRGSRQDYTRFLRIARGSLYEVRTQGLIAQRIGYLQEATAAPLFAHLDPVRRPLQGLVRSLDDRP